MKEILMSDAKKIVDFIISTTKENKYGLVVTKYFDSLTGGLIGPICNFDDIGDYLIYIAWYAKIKKDDKLLNWCKNQIRIWNNIFKINKGFYFGEYNIKEDNKPSKINPVFLYEHQDAFVGIKTLYEITKDNFYLQILKELIDATFKYAMNKKKRLRGRFLPYLNLPYPQFKKNIKTTLSSICSKPAIDGIVLEETVALFRITNDEEYLNYAKNLAKGWLSLKIFKKYGLFPDNIFPLINRPIIPKSSVTKANTNMLQGLISLWKILDDDSLLKEILKEKIIFALNSLEKMQLKNGAFYRTINYKKNEPYDRTILLGNNHALIAIYIEAYLAFKDDKYLEISKKCANYWLSLQNETNCLIPNNEKDNVADLDSEADIFTEFLKLYEITNDIKYLEAVKKGVRGISKYFRTNISFVNVIDINSGEPKLIKNEIKFLGGYLRILLYLTSFLENKMAKNNPIIWQLIRDR